MSLPDNWWTEDVEEDPCDDCGVTPSKHLGHGRFICKTCYEAWWCPKCTYRLTENHVCPSPEEHARRQKEHEDFMKSLDE